MSSSWIGQLSANVRGMLIEVIRHADFDTHAALLDAPRGRDTTTSRQARHEQLKRARSTAKVATMLLASQEPDVRRVLFSTEFARLRPLSADTHKKLASLTHLSRQIALRGATELFEAAWREIVDASGRLACLDRDGLLRIHNLFAGMHAAPLVCGAQFYDGWREAMKDARRRGLLENPHFRMQLALMGSYAGDSREQEAWLLDDATRDFELADFYCFVRTDERREIFDRTAALIRGDHVPPTSCLLAGRPESTLKNLLQYLLFCLRSTDHLDSPGHTLMILRTMEDFHRHALALHAQGMVDIGSAGLTRALARFQQVQQLDKERFWRTFDGLPEGRTKARLGMLWGRDLGTLTVGSAIGERQPS